MIHTSPAPASRLEVRNPKFGVDARDAQIPRPWHGAGRSITAFFDNLSIFFPAGERFFIASVRAHMRRVTDPELLAAVRIFNAQEGVHGREHQRYNAMLRDQGYPIDAMEGRVERLLARVTRITPKRWQLAATCALEHFTALMAQFLLADPRLLEKAHPTMAALWKWHAAEENEHKCVAYDVFLAAGGTYPERAGVMILATLIFWAKVIEHQFRMMHHDGIAFSLCEWMALGRFLLVEPGGFLPLVKHYVAYFRPTFHPRDIDSSALLEAWRSEYANAPEYRAAAA